MHARPFPSAAVAVVVLCAAAVVLVQGDARVPDVAELAAPAPVSAAARGGDLLGRVPAAFVPNVGQWQGPARYVARLGPVTARLDERGWWLGLCANAPRDPRAREDLAPALAVHGASLRMTFLGSETAELVGEDRLAGVHDYFLGSDPARWRTDVPRFGAVRCRGLYPGVEVRAYEQDGHLEYDLVLAPGADLSRVDVRVEGATAPLRLEADGTLVIETAVGPVRQPTPVSYEALADGTRPAVPCSYELLGADRFGFVAKAWDGGSELWVDPGLLYSTFLGGSIGERPAALSVDAAGVATVVGWTGSGDFPTTPGAWDTTFNGSSDAFVARLDPRRPTAQQLVYSTFLGGSGDELAWALSVDAAGVATVAGQTRSPDYPTTPGAWDTTHNGETDAFVARLDPRLPAAQQLVYSTFLGGSSLDWGFALSVDAAGVATVAGQTMSTGFPTTPGAWDTTFNGNPNATDAFVARLDPRLPAAQQLCYSTFLGGLGYDDACALSVDTAGVATVAGYTSSSDFPTTPGAWDRTFNGYATDAFVARLDPRLPAARQLCYSTFLGGSYTDQATAVSVDAAGVATVAGDTWSTDFPTTPGAWNTTHNGGPFEADAFVARLDPRLPTAQQLCYSTFLGGSAKDQAIALSVDVTDVVMVAGETWSTDFPTTPGAWDRDYNGGTVFGGDAFVARLDPRLPAAQQLCYSTFLGGSAEDQATAVSVDAAGVATVVGETRSTDFPTTPGAWDRTFNGGGTYRGGDTCVTRLELLPTGARVFGTSSPGCTGPLAIGVTSMPRIGNATFQLTCNNAPPSAMGDLLLAARGLASPLRVLGVDVWVDPSSAWFLGVSASSNATGQAYFVLPLPDDPVLVGEQLDAQFCWAGPSFPPPCPPLGLSASNALEVTIQP